MDLRKDFSLDGIKLCNFINLSKDEALKIREWRNHEDIRKWMYNDSIIGEEEHLSFIQGLKDKPGTGYWLVKKGGTEFGVLDITRIDFRNRNAHIGIYGNPETRMEGRGKVLAEAMKKLAFEELKMHTIHLEVIEDNDRAMKFYEKTGLRKEGVLKEFVFKDGLWKDVMIMGMTEDEHKNKG